MRWVEKKKERKKTFGSCFFESRQQTDSFWGCTKTLQTPNNPIRRPTGSCRDCFQNVRVQRESDAGWKYSHRFSFSLSLSLSLLLLLLNKTWANGSVVTELVFLSCCNCTCFKNACSPRNEFYKANLKIPESSWPHGTNREQYLAQSNPLLQPNTRQHKSNPRRRMLQLQRAAMFSDGLTGGRTASDFTKITRGIFTCDTIRQPKLWSTD